MGKRVLFVDDDITLGSIISNGLSAFGHEVHFQSSLSGVENATEDFQPHIIILDIEIGSKNGIDGSSVLRATFPHIPVIYASSHTNSELIVRALENGGSVYVKKPFDVAELAAYINKYAVGEYNNTVTFGNSSLNLTTRELRTSKESIPLSRSEFELLQLFVNSNNLILSRELIFKTVWPGRDSTNQVLNNNILKLRRYLEEDKSVVIETLPREGYRAIF